MCARPSTRDPAAVCSQPRLDCCRLTELEQFTETRPASFGLPSRVAALEEWAKGQGLMP